MSSSFERRPSTDRRRQADWVVKAAAILSVLSWIVAFSVTLLLDIAAPERGNMFSSLLGGTVQDGWNTTLLPIAFISLVMSLVCCIAAFIFNMMRMRRKSDKYRKSVIIMGFISMAGIIFFVINFGADLF